MSEGDALFRGVLDTPDDDVPRLIYADWLDDNNQPERAEFIRLQIDLAHTPRTDPRRQDWQRREKELLDQYAHSWAVPMGESVTGWAFRRGFIEKVETYLQHQVEAIRARLQLAPIRHIREVGTGYCAGGDNMYELQNLIAALPDLHRLRGLELWGIYSIHDGQLHKVLQSPHLAGLRTLILSLHGENWRPIDDGVLAEALASPHRANLRYLGVNTHEWWSSAPSEDVIRAMIASPHLTRVRKLKLPGTRLTAELLTGLFQAMPRLDQLDLGHVSAPEDAWNLLLARAEAGRLRWLCLGGAALATAEEGGLRLADVPRFRLGFQQAGVRVNWSSDFIASHNGGSWKGHSWWQRRQEHFHAMNSFVQAGDFDGLEATYREDARKYAGEQTTARITALPFEQYESSLDPGMRWAVAEAVSRNAGAIEVRVKGDRNWTCVFHLAAEAPTSTEPHWGDSRRESLATLPGPEFRAAGDRFLDARRSGPLDPDSLQHYLWARLVAAVGRCVRQYQAPVPVSVWAGWTVFRLPEG